MPELDGFQVAQALRERERTTGGHLPIIAPTARSRKEDRECRLAAGMDDFLAKPIQPADLWAAMHRLVGSRPPAEPPGPDLLAPGRVGCRARAPFEHGVDHLGRCDPRLNTTSVARRTDHPW